jgi:hypothetical protein
MNLPEYRDRILDRLNDQIEQSIDAALKVQRGIGLSAETIAFAILEVNAYRRALEAARSIVTTEYQKIVAPDSIPGGASEEEEIRELYN